MGISIVIIGLLVTCRSQLLYFFASHPISPIAQRVNVDSQREIVRAIAVWTENLRDAISASSGIEQAIASTAGHAPAAIDNHLQWLVGSMKYRPIEDCLRDFATALENPTADFVVASLLVSLRHPTRDLSSLLSHLSDCARAECDLYMRIWVSRARSRTSLRVITTSVVAFTLGLALFNPSYMKPFFSASGVVFLIGIVLCFAVGLLWLRQISTLEPPRRFLLPGNL